MHDDDADAGPGAEDPLLPAGPESPSRAEMVRDRTRALYNEIEHRREVRRCRLIEMATDSTHSSGLDLAAVNDRLLSDILEGGSSEHDPDLQELWANLLANALTDAAPVPRAFPELMRQLEPVEARLLRHLAVQEAKHLVGSWVEFHELADVPDDVEWRHLDNLERLGLLRFETSYPQNVELPSRPPRETMQIQLLLTRSEQPSSRRAWGSPPCVQPTNTPAAISPMADGETPAIKRSPRSRTIMDTHPYFFPVVLVNDSGQPTHLVGSAFSIFPGFLITCRHVVDIERAADVRIIDQATGRVLEAQEIRYSPHHEDLDLAAMVVPLGVNAPLPVLPSEALSIGEDVYTYGFYSSIARYENARSGYFKGHVVDALNQGGHPLMRLSFPAIEGLSGSPVMTYHHGVKVVGVLFGSESQRVLAREIIEFEAGETKLRETIDHIVEFGLAYQAVHLAHFLTDANVPYIWTDGIAEPHA